MLPSGFMWEWGNNCTKWRVTSMNPSATYDSNTEANAHVPDYGKLRTYKPVDNNRYIVCLLICN